MKKNILLTIALATSAFEAWWHRQSRTLALANADSWTGTLYTKRHCEFTITPAVAGVVPGKGQGWTHKTTAPQTELRSGGVLVSRSTGPDKEVLSLRWTYAAALAANIPAYVKPAIDEIVAITGSPITEDNGNYNVVSWETTGQEGDDLKGTCELVREDGAAMAALA
ncbi:MAG: hypothetical protein FD161_2976 [Limisphaerales bacterium]|nr:MAG: hypothetical protein FD161_2976 [Limisphaerales bacterium]KAG0508089.1 MAG: hypothetical protein E1N63_2683 [Limisphaerales bacterium]TXT53058.1 MAG: hypothetical protein FD140_166 [Limisphaerales bacterium]